MINENFVYLGSIVFLIGSWTYFIETLQGKVKPNRISWFLWGLNPLIAFFAMIQQGVGLSTLATFTYGAVPAAILTASFLNKGAYWKISKLDLICGALSLMGLILWYLTRVGDIAIIFSIIADLFAGVPTIIKSYKEPATENWKLFLANSFSAGITLATLKMWNFTNAGFLVYIFLVYVLITILVGFKVGPRLRKSF